jgi:hypothetical protein
MKFRAFALAGDPPSVLDFRRRPLNREEVGRLRRRNRIFSLVVIGCLRPGHPFLVQMQMLPLWLLFFPW